MAPGTNTGAAHPVTLGGGKMDDTMKEKLENDSAALMRSVVGKRGRNVEIAETAVRQSKSFTDQEALSQRLIDYVASSEDDLFKQLQGKQVKRFDGQTITLTSDQLEINKNLDIEGPGASLLAIILALSYTVILTSLAKMLPALERRPARGFEPVAGEI